MFQTSQISKFVRCGKPRLFTAPFVFALTLFGVCGLSSDAVADEMENDLNWTGFYLGLGGGYSNNKFKIRDRTSPRLFSSFNTDTDVGIVGLYAGYNYQIENVVLGLEADSYVGYGGKTRLASLPVPSSWKSKWGLVA